MPGVTVGRRVSLTKGVGEMTRKLFRDDGENLAVRAFLAAYGSRDITQTIGGMATHLKFSGFPYWPEWVRENRHAEHLTKAAAQDWLKHLFDLEGDRKLTSPAKVGGVVFGIGVENALVIKAAQGLYRESEDNKALTADQRRDEERKRRDLWDLINGPLYERN